MTQLTYHSVKGEGLSRTRFIGLSAMHLINAQTIHSGDLSDVPYGYKTEARKNAKKVISDAAKNGLTVEKPYLIKTLNDGSKGLFVLGRDGLYFASRFKIEC